MTYQLDQFHSAVASFLRAPRGIWVKSAARQNPPRPPKMVELYEFEGCPYCRKVRDVLTELDLAYISRPCPKGASRNRDKVEQLGGKSQFPYLVDPNTDKQLYESEAIIDYLFATYAGGLERSGAYLSMLNTLWASLPSTIRPYGVRRQRSSEGSVDKPERLWKLYNFENSPDCRRVRERLCEYEIDYRVLNAGNGSARRREMLREFGSVKPPVLVEPDNKRAVAGTDRILEFIQAK